MRAPDGVYGYIRQNTARVSWHQSLRIYATINICTIAFSHVYTLRTSCLKVFSAQPGFAQFTVSAANPFNPFHATVGVGYLFENVEQKFDLTTDFIQPLLGVGVTSWRVALGSFCLGVSGLVDHRFLKRRTRCDRDSERIRFERRGHCT